MWVRVTDVNAPLDTQFDCAQRIQKYSKGRYSSRNIVVFNLWPRFWVFTNVHLDIYIYLGINLVCHVERRQLYCYKRMTPLQKHAEYMLPSVPSCAMSIEHVSVGLLQDQREKVTHTSCVVWSSTHYAWKLCIIDMIHMHNRHDAMQPSSTALHADRTSNFLWPWHINWELVCNKWDTAWHHTCHIILAGSREYIYKFGFFGICKNTGHCVLNLNSSLPSYK